MQILKDAIRRAVIATHQTPGLKSLYRWIYRRSADVFSWGLQRKAGQELRGAYLRRGLSGDGWRPGVSDIDILVLLDQEIVRAGVRALGGIWRYLRRFKFFCPLLGEVQITTPAGLELFARAGGVRAGEIGGWKRLGRAAPLEAQPPSRSPAASDRERLREASRAYLELCRTCLDAASTPRLPPEFGFKVFKYSMDAWRYSRACGAAGTPTRSQMAEILGAEWRDVRRHALAHPASMTYETAMSFLRGSLLEIERATPVSIGAAHADDATDMPAPSLPGPRGFGAEVWRRRLLQLHQTPLLSAAGFCVDGFQGWLLILPEIPTRETFQAAWERMRRWRGGDNAFSGPGYLVTKGFVERMGNGLYAGTPFSRLAFPADPPGIAACSYTRRSLWAERYRVVGRWSGAASRRPRQESLRSWMRQAAAEFAVSWLSPWDAWNEAPAGNAGKLFAVASGLLSVRLFLRHGRLVDPADIDAILGACRDEMPGPAPALDRLEEDLLDLPETALDSMPPIKIFDVCRPLVQESLSALGIAV